MATSVNPAMPSSPQPEETVQDFQFPQREAAFFYGLFLRGHSAEKLRRDIEVPAAVLAKWDKETWRDPQLRPLLERIVRYRQHVLAIFENLIGHDSAKQKLQ
ncbi:MAG: hypothetical protein ABSF78_04330 [Candidatus Acidiferrales bacterium]|jgi:hypothetical protein